MRFSRSKRSSSPAKKSRPKPQLKDLRSSPTHDMVVVPTPARLTINFRPIDRLRLNPDNPRLHTEKQVKLIARSVQTFGFNVPVLVDGNLQVVAGPGRLQAARFLGMVEVGSCRRELLDHIIALNERHLKKFLADYIRYYHDDRTHLGLNKQTPGTRVRSGGRACIISYPRLGGLHHRYERAA